MKRLFTASASAALLGIVGITTAAHATAPEVAPQLEASPPPAECAGRFDARQFGTGFDIGARTVHAAVSRVNDCDQIDQVTDFIIDTVDRLTPPAGSTSTRIACRFAGIVEGVLSELDNQNFACEGSCTAEGEEFGLLSAELYCDLSIFFGGLLSPDPLFRRPVNTCGFFYEVSCDSQFISTSQSFVDPAGEACLPFTEGEFEEVWVQSRANQCAYDPEVGPQVRSE